jgi:hypothetical protein
MLKKVIRLYIVYKIIRILKWANKGIYWYISILIGIIKTIVTHPMYKVLKYIFQTLLMIESLLIVIYFSGFKDLSYYLAAFPSYISFDLNQIYKNILRYVRDIIDYLINDEGIVQDTKNYESISINNEKTIKDTNVNNNWYY